MSTGKQQVKLLSITVSGGAGTGTVTSEWALARWVRVIPTTESDTYDVSFKDADGDLIGSYTGQTGTFSAQLNLSLGILRTVAIANSSSTGTYKTKFDMH